MPEIIDLYDNTRRFVCSVERGSEIPDDLNKISVHVWFINNKQEFLLQQRVATAEPRPANPVGIHVFANLLKNWV